MDYLNDFPKRNKTVICFFIIIAKVLAEAVFYFTALASQRRVKNRIAKAHENKSVINPAFHPK
jgi:hypothetical protein